MQNLNFEGLPPLPDNRAQAFRGLPNEAAGIARTEGGNHEIAAGRTMNWACDSQGQVVLDLSALARLHEIEVHLPEGRILRYNGREFPSTDVNSDSSCCRRLSDRIIMIHMLSYSLVGQGLQTEERQKVRIHRINCP